MKHSPFRLPPHNRVQATKLPVLPFYELGIGPLSSLLSYDSQKSSRDSSSD